MGKKRNTEKELPGKKGKNIREPFTFLNETFENVEKSSIRTQFFYLIIIAIVTKLAVIFLTTNVFHSFVDLFDIGFYLEHGILIFQGQLPYIDYPFDYPVLIFIPIALSLIPLLVFQNVMAFVYSFQVLMVLCDIITLGCIYLIALKIGNQKTAFLSGLVYATAFSTSYFVLTKYDAFPTCLLMLGILFTIYGMNMRGYLAATLGFFAKIFPAVAFPFMILYNAKTTSVRQEIIDVLKITVPCAVILLLPFILIRPDVINTYLFATGSSVGVYVNTATYTLYAYLQEIGHLGISQSVISAGMYLLMGIVFLILLVVAYKYPEKNPRVLIKILLCALFSIIFFTKFHSPQYIVWFTPFLCLLVADDIYTIILFYITQIFAYIEFPLMFGTFYTNLEYVNPVGSGGWYMTLLFFTLEYALLLILMYMVIRPGDLYGKIFRRTE